MQYVQGHSSFVLYVSMTEAVVVITGKIATGKTTLAHCLARRLECPVVSFGEFVRAQATDASAEKERHVLQDEYSRLVSERGASGFTVSALRHAGLTPPLPAVIIEGVREASLIDALREFARPRRLVWIHLSPAEEEREARASRREIPQNVLTDADKHWSEREATSGLLNERADLVISNGDAASVCDEAFAFLESPEV